MQGRNPKSRSNLPESVTPRNSDQIFRTLCILDSARRLADEVNSDLWEFAVEIDELIHHEICRQDLRQMVALNWVEHRREIHLPNLDHRQFQGEGKYTFSDRTCFVITTAGQAQMRQIQEAMEGTTYVQDLPTSAPRVFNPDRPTIQQLNPVWDRDKRELRLGDYIVKRFKWPAKMQFAILDCFEQQGWPSRIANPLPSDENVSAKSRLHDAIKCLNQRKLNELIRFRGDGTGQGVLVQFASQVDQDD